MVRRFSVSQAFAQARVVLPPVLAWPMILADSDAGTLAPVASSWIVRRARASGGVSYRVEFRLGGRDTRIRYGGSFGTKREALARRQWIDGELAAMRVPNLAAVSAIQHAEVVTVRTAAAAWQASRVDVSIGTATTHRTALARVLPRIGSAAVAELDARDVAALVAQLHAAGLARESIRKTLGVLAMVLAHAGVPAATNPARDRVTVRLPRADRAELNPPTAAHVEAVYRLLPSRYRLALLTLDATGMRVGELEALTWGDVDEPRSRWRVTSSASKTGRARWVPVAPPIFAAVVELRPRDDRVPGARVFADVTADRLRTAIARACVAAGVPTFSPHDLRHRRISLLHLAGVPWATIGAHVGQRSLSVTADTYSHVMADELELDYAGLLQP